MSQRDIDVDENELYQFIQVLEAFQSITQDRFRAVSEAWKKVNESWQGESKKQFAGQYELTEQSVDATLKAGKDALMWLERFDEIVKEFERDYR
jgi:uncharacterized protein YukE